VTVDTADSLPTWEHAVQARIGGAPALRQAHSKAGPAVATFLAGACSVLATARCRAALLSHQLDMLPSPGVPC
jgi:hypothetical protein